LITPTGAVGNTCFLCGLLEWPLHAQTAHWDASNTAQRVTSVVASAVSPAPRDAWSELLASDHNATIYQTPAWFEAVRSVTGATDVSRLYVLEDGRRLLLPMLSEFPPRG
jgi:CelD/BcsL family acetyltransferase involved in cellulose biosynthesis